MSPPSLSLFLRGKLTDDRESLVRGSRDRRDRAPLTDAAVHPRNGIRTGF